MMDNFVKIGDLLIDKTKKLITFVTKIETDKDKIQIYESYSPELKTKVFWNKEWLIDSILNGNTEHKKRNKN